MEASASPGYALSVNADELTEQVLTREFRDQFEINTSQLMALQRMRRELLAKRLLLISLVLLSTFVILIALLFSFSYIKHQISTTTVGPLYDFGLSIIIILGLLLGLTFIAYYFMILLYRIDETAGELRELISRQKAAIAEMAPYIAEESDSA